MIWHGQRIYLRPMGKDDFPFVVRWSQDKELQRLMDVDRPESLEECETWLEGIRRDRQHRLFALMTNANQLIGDMELSNISWRSREAEMRVRIGEKEYWNQGLGTDAITTLLTYGFFQLNLKRIYLRVYSFNHRAIHCYEKCGFRKAGILRLNYQEEPREVILMQVLQDEFFRMTGRSAHGSVKESIS